MASAGDVEFTIVAKDEASAVMRRISRQARRTGFWLGYQRLIISAWTLLLFLAGAAFGFWIS